MAWLADYGLFLAKCVTILAALIVLIVVIAATARGRKGDPQQRLRVRSLNRQYERTRELLEAEILESHARKQAERERRNEHKARSKAAKRGLAPRPRVYVLKFDGDVQASAVEALREEITALLQIATAQDEVVVRLESPGGMVAGYGLAASQLARIRSRGVHLTIAIDKVAASGGYMMACVAHQILAAPFAVVGSIGVVAQLPNFSRVLKKHDVDVELHTAGQYKRTLTVFGENTDEGRAKFREELEEVHGLFKHFVAEYRPSVPIDEVSTGEHWYGSQALRLKLVDRLVTVDDYLQERLDTADLFEITWKRPRGVVEQLLRPAARIMQRALSVPFGLREG